MQTTSGLPSAPTPRSLHSLPSFKATCEAIPADYIWVLVYQTRSPNMLVCDQAQSSYFSVLPVPGIDDERQLQVGGGDGALVVLDLPSQGPQAPQQGVHLVGVEYPGGRQGQSNDGEDFLVRVAKLSTGDKERAGEAMEAT